jgi:hypothetical protein
MRRKLDDKGCRSVLSLAEEGVEYVINKEGSIPFIHGGCQEERKRGPFWQPLTPVAF